MALCVRRLRGATGLGDRWRNGARGAGGGVSGRLREGGRIREVTWYPELSPCPPVPEHHRHPSPSTRSSVLPRPRHGGAALYPLLAGHGKAPRQDVLKQNKGQTLPLLQHFPPQPVARPLDVCPLGMDCWHLSSSQLDCFRSLFEPGVCRTPYQALVLPCPGTPPGVLAFQLAKPAGKSPSSGGSQPDMEQHLAVMHAKLREELPKLLVKSLDYSIYRKDVEFSSSVLHVHTRGLVLYQMLMFLSQFLFQSYFCNTSTSVLKLTSHPESGSIQARWSVSGLPLHSLIFYVFRADKTDLYRTYDAHSTFYLASDGLIRLHKLERVMPSAPLTVPKKTILAAALLALGLEEHRPALNFLFFSKHPQKL